MRTVRDTNKKRTDPPEDAPPRRSNQSLLRFAGYRDGLAVQLVLSAVGISYDSFITWKREDPEFNQKVEAAAAKAAARLVMFSHQSA